MRGLASFAVVADRNVLNVAAVDVDFSVKGTVNSMVSEKVRRSSRPGHKRVSCRHTPTIHMPTQAETVVDG